MAGDQPASERPSLALRGRLAARGVPVLFTIDTGAVTAHCDGGVWTVETIDGRRYVAQREAGRIVFHVR